MIHEFNAIGWAAQNYDGRFLRSHSEKITSQHAKFLRQIEEDSADHKNAVSWFRSLPIWLDLPGLRVIHACWHDPSRAALLPFLGEHGCLTEAGLLESYRHGSDAHAAVEILLNSERMLAVMKATAKAKGFADLIAPVRPIQKHSSRIWRAASIRTADVAGYRLLASGGAAGQTNVKPIAAAARRE